MAAINFPSGEKQSMEAAMVRDLFQFILLTFNNFYDCIIPGAPFES